MNARVLDAAALDTNRAGRLTDAQREAFVRDERLFGGQMRGAAAVCAALGLIIALGASASVPLISRVLVAGAFFAAAAAAGWISIVGRPGLERDLRQGRVVTVDGAIGRDRFQGRGAEASDYYLMIDGRRYRCSRQAYEDAAEPGIARLYVLPSSRRVVNVERLPDRPLPEGALTPAGATSIAANAIREVLLHPGGGRSDALATAVAVEHAMLGWTTGPDGTMGPASASATASDVPLAQAIVGRWHNPLATVTFASDGAASAEMANGMRMDGRWSVDATGQLHVAGLGDDTAGAATVSGDRLTITLGGTPVSFGRVAA